MPGITIYQVVKLTHHAYCTWEVYFLKKKKKDTSLTSAVSCEVRSRMSSELSLQPACGIYDTLIARACYVRVSYDLIKDIHTLYPLIEGNKSDISLTEGTKSYRSLIGGNKI